jgi:hypothetical protein
MTFDFYCGSHQYMVSSGCVARDGEVVAQGVISINELLLGRPAVIIIQANHECKYIKTEKVTAVLPQYETFNGRLAIKRKFRVRNKRKQIEISAISRQHANALSEMFL